MDNSTGKFLRALLGLFVLGVVAYVSFFGGYFTNNNQIVENENDAAELNTDLIGLSNDLKLLIKTIEEERKDFRKVRETLEELTADYDDNISADISANQLNNENLILENIIGLENNIESINNNFNSLNKEFSKLVKNNLNNSSSDASNNISEDVILSSITAVLEEIKKSRNITSKIEKEVESLNKVNSNSVDAAIRKLSLNQAAILSVLQTVSSQSDEIKRMFQETKKSSTAQTTNSANVFLSPSIKSGTGCNIKKLRLDISGYSSGVRAKSIRDFLDEKGKTECSKQDLVSLKKDIKKICNCHWEEYRFMHLLDTLVDMME